MVRLLIPRKKNYGIIPVTSLLLSATDGDNNQEMRDTHLYIPYQFGIPGRLPLHCSLEECLLGLWGTFLLFPAMSVCSACHLPEMRRTTKRHFSLLKQHYFPF
jgi:hypothetical protein